MKVDQFVLLAVVICGPTAAGFTLLLWMLDRRAARTRWPILELQRRPPGESTRLKIDALTDKLMFWVFVGVGWPAIILLSASYRPLPGAAGMAIWVTMGCLVTVVAVRGIWRVLSELRDYRLGFEGERDAGGHLDELMRDGFEVFHDVPFDNFNIDHVLVGPRGVYSVETKTRRKSRNTSAGFEWRVFFTGDALEFSWGKDRFGLEQAARNAQTLQQWIYQSTREKVPVQPVLMLPGWMVERRARGSVTVINPKEARGLFGKAAPSISLETVGRIAFQLRQKSRVDLGQ
ncbi:MAG: nuclease-related domain-containing protein [Terrimicrobiaceae bacterium]|nr:nuclease-related domain-containing protein [Terrimicrobiaceae bacterium]